jgi:soluble lytic murein transglycosylase-like protein
MNPAELESYIRSVAPEFGLDPELCVRQCMAESSLGRNLHPSSAGARGVMQLMPIALADLAKRFHFICDPDDAKQCVRGGLTLMQWLMDKYRRAARMSYPGDPTRKAYAAYNWGAGDVDAMVHAYGEQWEAHIPRETLDYVHKICGTDNVIAVPHPKGTIVTRQGAERPRAA